MPSSACLFLPAYIVLGHYTPGMCPTTNLLRLLHNAWRQVLARSRRRRGPHPHLQALTDGRIRLLVGHPASDPLCPRLLRGCAALLSPISVALAPACAAGIALYDDPPAVMPRLVAGGRLGVDGSGQAGASGVAHGSLLLTAGNYGVAVVEAEMLTNKWV